MAGKWLTGLKSFKYIYLSIALKLAMWILAVTFQVYVVASYSANTGIAT